MAVTPAQPFQVVFPATRFEARSDDELFASRANLVDRPFDVVDKAANHDDDGGPTREYDARVLSNRPSHVTRHAPTRQVLKDARVGLDLFLGEAAAALMVGHQDMTEQQRLHLTKIMTFIEALGERFDRVMQVK